jgi:hypothetical protein
MTSQTTTSIAPRLALGRFVYATLAALLLTAIVLDAFTHGAGYWQIAAFGTAPDLSLFYGASKGLAKGQLHSRAVGLYNLMHRFWGPLAMLVLAAFGLIGLGFLIGALAWAFHIALDRAIGYGLRTPDGFPRP